MENRCIWLECCKCCLKRVEEVLNKNALLNLVCLCQHHLTQCKGCRQTHQYYKAGARINVGSCESNLSCKLKYDFVSRCQILELSIYNWFSLKRLTGVMNVIGPGKFIPLVVRAGNSCDHYDYLTGRLSFSSCTYRWHHYTKSRSKWPFEDSYVNIDIFCNCRHFPACWLMGTCTYMLESFT